MKNTMDDFRKRVKEARKNSGISQQQLADKMSNLLDNRTISRVSISLWESENVRYKGVDAANLLKFCRVLNVDPYWIMFGLN